MHTKQFLKAGLVCTWKECAAQKNQGHDAPTTCVGEIKLIEYPQNMMHKRAKNY